MDSVPDSVPINCCGNRSIAAETVITRPISRAGRRDELMTNVSSAESLLPALICQTEAGVWRDDKSMHLNSGPQLLSGILELSCRRTRPLMIASGV